MASPNPNDGATPRVSLRDIARAVGVSASAVSLALKNSAKISPARRQLIQKKARQMGYHPDPMLAALCQYRNTRRSHPIAAELAWLNLWPDPRYLHRLREYELFWQGASARAGSLGFRLEEFCLKSLGSFKRMEEILLSRGINGILLPPALVQFVDTEHFQWEKFTVVRFGNSTSNLPVHLVCNDQLSSGMTARFNMRRLGYEHSGFVGDYEATLNSTRFLAGFYQDHLRSHSRQYFPSPLLLRRSDNRMVRAKQLAEWIQEHRPEAIFTDIIDIRALLQDCGLACPRDLGLASTTVLDIDVDAGIDQNSFEIGQAAVEMLVSLMQNNQRGFPHVCRKLLIEGKWCDGLSLPAKNRQKP